MLIHYSPELLQLLSAHYTWIEWGVLFRPDLAGTPRYASDSWLKSLIEVCVCIFFFLFLFLLFVINKNAYFFFNNNKQLFLVQ